MDFTKICDAPGGFADRCVYHHGAFITITYGYASHTALAEVFGDKKHTSEKYNVLFTITILLVCHISYYLYRNLQRRVPVLWELHKAHHSAEVMVGSVKDRDHPVDDVMKRIWAGLITGFIYGIWLFFAFDPIEITIMSINFCVI